MKDPKDKNKLIVDHEAKETVLYIFNQRISGLSFAQIAKKLNDQNIKSPLAYKFEKGIVKSQSYKDILWTTSSVKNLIKNPVYTGQMVQGRKKSVFLNGFTAKNVSKSNWIRLENTHEPIIEKPQFEKAVYNSKHKLK